MKSGSPGLRSLVDGLSAAELDEPGDAVASRLCREKYGADTIEGLLAKWGQVGARADLPLMRERGSMA